VLWLVWQTLSTKNSKHIPLAGLQALLFVTFLWCHWWLKIINPLDDAWLLNFITK